MTDIDAALRKKEMGNESYKNGDFTTALTLFNEAIDLDGNNETFYCNRSMCHAALKDWWSSISDARKAILMNPKYVKAHFRLIKALLELKLYKEGRLCLLNAFNVCGDSKEFKVLDDEITLESGVPVRPKPNDFDIVDDLGEGNFSKIFRAIYKPTGCSFAMKVLYSLVQIIATYVTIHDYLIDVV
jgi:tetratricopeptide (TPR) repeat protein